MCVLFPIKRSVGENARSLLSRDYIHRDGSKAVRADNTSDQLRVEKLPTPSAHSHALGCCSPDVEAPSSHLFERKVVSCDTR